MSGLPFSGGCTTAATSPARFLRAPSSPTCGRVSRRDGLRTPWRPTRLTSSLEAPLRESRVMSVAAAHHRLVRAPHWLSADPEPLSSGCPQPIRVLVADDHAAVRLGVQRLFD